MTDKLKQELNKAFESYYQYLDEGTGCHNTIIELKTAIDLAIAEIEEKDDRIASLEGAIRKAKSKIEIEGHSASASVITECRLCEAINILQTELDKNKEK